jgi:hypothetical protein
MIKIDSTHVFFHGLKKVYYSILFLTSVVFPCSIKAMDDDRALGASSQISKKREETTKSFQEEKFLGEAI